MPHIKISMDVNWCLAAGSQNHEMSVFGKFPLDDAVTISRNRGSNSYKGEKILP